MLVFEAFLAIYIRYAMLAFDMDGESLLEVRFLSSC